MNGTVNIYTSSRNFILPKKKGMEQAILSTHLVEILFFQSRTPSFCLNLKGGFVSSLCIFYSILASLEEYTPIL